MASRKTPYSILDVVRVSLYGIEFTAEINGRREAWNLDPTKPYNTQGIYEYLSLRPTVTRPDGTIEERNRIIFRHEEVVGVVK